MEDMIEKSISIYTIDLLKEIPVEYTFLPGSKHDSEALKQLPFDLKQGSRVYADAGYTTSKIENILQQAEQNQLLVARKNNSATSPVDFSPLFPGKESGKQMFREYRAMLPYCQPPSSKRNKTYFYISPLINGFNLSLSV